MSSPRIAVIGATGFIGRHVCAVIESRGATPIRVEAPRLASAPPSQIYDRIAVDTDNFERLRRIFLEVDVVINAAGIANPRSNLTGALASANSVLPGIAGRACRAAGVERFIQVSSAAVQGRVATLDARPAARGFSDYSWSKVVGERAALHWGPTETIVFRPPGVHGADRSTSRLMTSVASSAFSAASRPGTQPTPQALIENVADAIVFLARYPGHVDPIVHYPWEGLTTASLMHILGNRKPLLIPPLLASGVVSSLYRLSVLFPGLRASTRRLEILWFGQAQAASWLEANGWEPPLGLNKWRSLGRLLRSS